ncbi:MAG TPA: 4-hydroxy-tetrahydrodipicolinate synthase [Clostridia bacterium]|nr:4-hydroxy-tetrahydrodipicolinate synthase [Clostridia bacterium]
MFTEFGHVLTAMVTPFDQEGNVNLTAAADLAVTLIGSGSDGLVVGGTTGESPVLSKQEKLELFSTVKKVVGEKATVIAGVGTYSTQDSIDLAREAQDLGVDGVMLVVPYYNKPSQEGLYQHFQAIASRIEVPVMLYNVPSRTSRNLEPETVSRLAEIKNIVAIKEAAGMMDQVSELKRLVPEDFIIYSGDDSLTLPMLALGAHGVVSVASHLVGKKLQDMVKAFFAGQWQQALSIHQELFPLFKSLFLTTNPVPVKTALKLLGYPVGEVKLPLVPLTVAEEGNLKDALKKAGLLC